MPSGSRSRSRQKTAAVALLILAVVAGALRYGGVEPGVAAGCAAVALAALALAWPRRALAAPGPIPRFGTGIDGGLPLLPLGLAVGAVFVALQLIPLPPGLLKLLSPNAAALFDETLAPVGRWPAWRPLSLAPGETASLLVVAVAVAAAAAAAAFLGEKRDRADTLLRAIAWTGLAAVILGLGAALLGFGPLLVPRLIFINPNHHAGFLVLSAWPAFGFALRARGKERVGWLAAFAFASTGVFLSLSRGGITAFFVAAAVSSVLTVVHGHTPLTVALLPYARKRASRTVTPAPGRSSDGSAPSGTPLPRWGRGQVLKSLALPVGVAAALAISAWLALDPVLGELETLSGASQEVKPSLWPDGLRLARQFPVAGIGRGAFATVYPSLKTEPTQVTFTHLENSWLQLPVDVGIPVGLLVLGVSIWAWVAAARQPELSRPMIGALAGAAGVAAQNLVDFSFEVTGVALPFALVLGLASRAMPRVAVRRGVGLAGAGLLAALAATGFAVHRREPGEAVAERISKANTSQEASALAAEALAWRPADWVPPAATGVRIVAAGKCSEGLPWLVRAMRRNPTAPEPHRYAARCLAAGGRTSLAKQEFRLASLYGDGEALGEALRRFPEPGALLAIAPQTPSGLVAAARLLRDRPLEARDAWRRAWEDFLDPRALDGLARVTIELGEPEEGLALARKLQTVSPNHPGGWLIAALALDDLDKGAEAITELEQGAERLPGNGPLLGALGRRLLAAKRPSQARAVLERIVAMEGPALAQKKLLVARTYADQGRLAEALASAQDAAASDRASAGPLEAVAVYANAAGRFDLAIDALERASRLPGAKAGAYDERIGKLRAAAVERQLKGR